MPRYASNKMPQEVKRLMNKLGIRDRSKLDRVMNSIATVVWLDSQTLRPDVPDFAYLQRIHIDMFGQLFDWPRQVRDVDTAAGDTGIDYAPHSSSTRRWMRCSPRSSGMSTCLVSRPAAHVLPAYRQRT